MRKKKLIEQNMLLFKQLGDANIQLDKLKLEQKRHLALIEKLQNEIEDKKKETALEPLKVLEKKVLKTSADIPDDIQFASEIIGDLVMEAAKLSNTLTAGGETSYKELVNLILGKTEVSKADILAVVEENLTFDQKKEKLIRIKEDTLEYFNSVMAQR